MATVTYIKETRQHISAMRGVMRYCMREDKTWDEQSGQRLISGINCDGMNSILEFEATKAAHGKMDGINFYQYVQSFKPTENITPSQAHEIAMEFAARAWPGAEVLVTTHCDANHVHSHFIINSVNFETGLKLRQDPNTLKFLRLVSDDICMTYGFSVLPKYEGGGKKMSAREWRAAQKGQSWKFRLMYDISDAMKKSQSKEDFIILMKRKGYEVKWTDERKDITFTCPNGMKCRGSRLHQERFRKENIENEFRLRKQLTGNYISRQSDPSQWTGRGNPAENPLRDGGLRYPGGVAGGRNESASPHREVPAGTLQDDRYAGNPAGLAGSADGSAGSTANGESGVAELHAAHPATGWEREREIFFRNVRDALRQSQGYGSYYGAVGAEGQKADPHFGGSLYGGIGAGLRGLASAGRLIEDDSEDPDERRKRIEAEQAGSNVGTILGLAIGAAMALAENKSTEEQAIQDEQDFNEFLAELEAEEEHTWQQTM